MYKDKQAPAARFLCMTSPPGGSHLHLLPSPSPRSSSCPHLLVPCVRRYPGTGRCVAEQSLAIGSPVVLLAMVLTRLLSGLHHCSLITIQRLHKSKGRQKEIRRALLDMNVPLREERGRTTARKSRQESQLHVGSRSKCDLSSVIVARDSHPLPALT